MGRSQSAGCDTPGRAEVLGALASIGRVAANGRGSGGLGHPGNLKMAPMVGRTD